MSEALSAAERAALGRLLSEERARLEAAAAGLARSFEDMMDRAEVEPADDEHDPDGTTAYERAQLSSLAESARRRLAEIDQALASLDAPSFGRCQSCGESIGLARLEALPGTPRCVRCAAGR